MQIRFRPVHKIRCEDEIVHELDKSKEKEIVTHRTKRNTTEFAIASLGVSGILAIMVFLSICIIVVTQSLQGKAIAIPSFFSEVATLMVGYYFGSRGLKDKDETQKRKVGFSREKPS